MIDPKRHYSLYEIVKLRLIPWVKTIVQASNLVRTDKLTNNFLDASVLTSSKGKIVEYRVKGENIARYLAQVDDVRLKIADVENDNVTTYAT